MKKTILLTAVIACATCIASISTISATTNQVTPTPAAPTQRALPGNTSTPGTNQFNNGNTPSNYNNMNNTNAQRNAIPNNTNTLRRTTPLQNNNMNDTNNMNNMNNMNNVNDTANRGTLRTIMVNSAVRLSMSGATGAIKINDSNSYKQIDVSVDIDNTKMKNAQLVIDIPKNLILGSYSNGEDIASIQNTTNIIQPDGSRTLTFNFLPNTSGTQKLDFLVMLPNGAFGAAVDYTITARLDQTGSTTEQLTDTLRLIPMDDNDLK